MVFIKKESAINKHSFISRLRFRQFSGFTVVELLVVVGLVGILSGITLTTMNVKDNYENAYDSTRKSDLNTLHKSFVQYYIENRCIPPTILWDGYQCGEPVPPELAPYLSKIPCDPETNEKYAYEALDNTCKQCNGGCGVCVGFRLLTQLKHEKNEPPAGAGCKKDVGCGKNASNGKPYNYGIAMSNACVIPTPTYFLTPTPLSQKLQLTSMCSNDPTDSRNWSVINQNNNEILFSWKLSGSNQSGVETVPAGSPQTPGEVFFSTVTEPGENTTIIYVNGVQQDVKASSGAACQPTPTNIPTSTPTPLPTAIPTITQTPSATPTPSSLVGTPCVGNLLPNGSFEIDSDNNRWPDGWGQFGIPEADEGIVCTEGTVGNCKFVQHYYNSHQLRLSFGYIDTITRPTSISGDAGTIFTYSYDVKTSPPGSVGDATMGFQLILSNTDGTTQQTSLYVDTDKPGVAVPDTWYHGEKTVVALKPFKNIYMSGFGHWPQGRYFSSDNLCLTKSP